MSKRCVLRVIDVFLRVGQCDGAIDDIGGWHSQQGDRHPNVPL